jgi:hypothetical protein
VKHQIDGRHFFFFDPIVDPGGPQEAFFWVPSGKKQHAFMPWRLKSDMITH